MKLLIEIRVCKISHASPSESREQQILRGMCNLGYRRSMEVNQQSQLTSNRDVLSPPLHLSVFDSSVCPIK